MRRDPKRLRAVLGLLLVCGLATGCFNPFRPLVGRQLSWPWLACRGAGSIVGPTGGACDRGGARALGQCLPG